MKFKIRRAKPLNEDNNEKFRRDSVIVGGPSSGKTYGHVIPNILESQAMKTTISEKEVGAMLKNALDFIEYMVLNNKIMLQDIPAETRLLSSTIYIYAFRASRNISKERYLNDLATLRADIEKCDDRDTAYLQHIYESYYENIKYIKVD